MNFDQLALDPRILKAIQICGYTQATPIQEKAIPVILEKKDIVATAQTGTGKTAAYVLPMLHHLCTQKPTGKTRALIMLPTRELATQVNEVITCYGKFTQPRLVSLIGGMAYSKQMRMMSRPVDIIVATPGRLMDYMKNHRLDLSGIEILVLDEADRMLDMGFINDIKKIVAAAPKNRQTLLLSATADDKLLSLVKNMLNHPVRINLSQDKVDPSLIKQELYLVNHPQHKMQLLQHFLTEKSIYKAIIFSATKRNAKKLTDHLRDAGHDAAALHGDLRQSVRNRTMMQLRNGRIKILVATDVAARGLDVPDISHVINFDIPKFSEDYVHRIGRTGRAGKTGVAISFATRSESFQIKQIERRLGRKLECLTVQGLEFKTPEGPEPREHSHSSKRSHSFGSRRGNSRSSERSYSSDSRRGNSRSSERSYSSDSPRGNSSSSERPYRSDSRRENSRSSERSYSSDSPRGNSSSFERPYRSDSRRGNSRSSAKPYSSDSQERDGQPRSKRPFNNRWKKPFQKNQSRRNHHRFNRDDRA